MWPDDLRYYMSNTDCVCVCVCVQLVQKPPLEQGLDTLFLLHLPVPEEKQSLSILSLIINIPLACKGIACPPWLCPTLNRFKREALYIPSLRLDWVRFASEAPYNSSPSSEMHGVSQKHAKKNYLESVHSETFGLAPNFILPHHC